MDETSKQDPTVLDGAWEVGSSPGFDSRFLFSSIYISHQESGYGLYLFRQRKCPLDSSPIIFWNQQIPSEILFRCMFRREYCEKYFEIATCLLIYNEFDAPVISRFSADI